MSRAVVSRRRWTGLGGLLLLWLLCAGPRSAQAADTPALPDLAIAQSPAYQRSVYPDWDGRTLRSASLAERRRSEGGIIGTLSLDGAPASWVSVLYYSETAQGYSLLDALPLPAGQQTQLTFPLPPGDDGLTRLLVWSGQPDAAELAALERSALDAQRRVPGLLDERWFKRSAAGTAAVSTDDRLRYEHPPAGILRSRAPYVWATLGADNVVSAKNCAVRFNGMTRVGTDSWGAYGQWQLGAGSGLTVQLVLPSRREYSRAILRLSGQLNQGGLAAKPALLQLDLNNFRAGEVQPVSPIGTMEQISFDLSQTIGYGLNTLVLRNGAAGGGGDWLLQNFELWVE